MDERRRDDTDREVETFGNFAVASERERRRRAKAQGRWPSEEVTDEMRATVARAIGRQVPLIQSMNPLLRMLNWVEENLGLPPRTSGSDSWRGPQFTAALAYEMLGSHPHNDIVEAVLKAIDTRMEYGGRVWNSADSLAEEIDRIWLQYGYAYQLRPEGRRWMAIRRDSDFLDGEVPDHALRLLEHHGFTGPLHEFEDALGKLGHDEDGAAVEANNAFESTMKAIWSLLEPGMDVHVTAAQLLAAMDRLGLLAHPRMREVLQLLPTLRNQPGAGHGSGPTPRTVPFAVASLMVHLTGAAIVFLIRRFDEEMASRAARAKGRAE